MKAVFKRELAMEIRSRTFVIGTILIPLLLIGMVAFLFFLFRSSLGGHHSLAIIDATGAGIGEAIAVALREGDAAPASHLTFRVELIPGEGDSARVRGDLDRRVAADSLDAYLWLSPGVQDLEPAAYVGRNAANAGVTGAVRRAVQRAVHEARLTADSIDPALVSAALDPVELQVRTTGRSGPRGSGRAARLLAYAMGMTIYLMIGLYGAGVLLAVVEEKRERIVEPLMVSIGAFPLIAGKIFGVGTAGLIQLSIWVAATATLATWGPGLLPIEAPALGTLTRALASFPQVPAGTVALFLLYFLGGYFIFASLYAILGASASNMEEVQGLAFFVFAPLLAGFLMLDPAMANPDSGVALAGSLLPFSSPLIMPARMVVTDVPWPQIAGSLAILAVSILTAIIAAARVYRIGVVAAGRPVGLRDIWRWAWQG